MVYFKYNIEMIYLYPHSGLANRIRVIISGLSFSDTVKQELTLIWSKDNSLYCDFTDLFEKDDKIILKHYEWLTKIRNRVQNKKILKRIFNKIFSIDFSLFDEDFKELVWSTGTDNINLGKLPEKVNNYYISTCNEFHFNKAYLKYLRPTAIIKNNIDRNIAEFTNKTIGVHIRRTDNAASIQESPLERFIEIMRNDLMRDPAINYYLATDDMQVEIAIKDLFPGKILTYQKDYSRTSVKGVQDAMVDLYTLSATCKIYGSYYSSFSDIASRIGDIPLNIVRKS